MYPFDRPVTLDPRNLASPYDERDYLIEIRRDNLVKEYYNEANQRIEETISHLMPLRQKNNFGIGLSITDQGNTPYCTTFSAMRNAGNRLAGAKSNKWTAFRDSWNDDTMFAVARQQFGWIERIKNKIFRPEIWKMQGYHPRAAFASLAKGVTLPNGYLFKTGPYYRVKAQTPDELCHVIEHMGTVSIAFYMKGDSLEAWFDPNGVYHSTGGRVYGHEMELEAYDRVNQRFKVANSWGEDCPNTNEGYNYIPFSYFADIGEIWLSTKPQFYAPMENLLTEK